MSRIVACVFLVGSLMSSVEAWQSRGGGPIRACSLLTKELALKVTAANKRIFDLLPPEEEPLGVAGSSCEYGDIGLQVDPFTPARLDQLYKQNGKDWTPVTGVGDAAYFRDNGGRFAELYVRVGGHTFTIQMGVPTGGTAAAIKPNTITLATALVPKLK